MDAHTQDAAAAIAQTLCGDLWDKFNNIISREQQLENAAEQQLGPYGDEEFDDAIDDYVEHHLNRETLQQAFEKLKESVDLLTVRFSL